MENVALRECPRCTADAAIIVGKRVECAACEMVGPEGRDGDDAAGKWNGPTATVIRFEARRAD